jgi:hypothetical protein
MKRFVLAILLATALTGGAFAANESLKPSEKVALQAAMFQHIDSQLVNGAFLQLNARDGRAEQLAPTKAHPMILRMGEHFVLCSDFKRPDGKEVNIDFYMARTGSKYVVFHTEIDNRKPLENLMSAGKITAAE